MEELIKKIENWAEERNLIKGSTPQKQFIKLMEEFGELCAGISKNNIELIKDSIGDCAIVCVIFSSQLKLGQCYIDTCYKSESVADLNNEFSCLKLSENLGYIAQLITSNSKEKNDILKLALARVGLYLIKIALNFNLDFKDCLNSAYNEIKDRKGSMINGVFVKEGDL